MKFIENVDLDKVKKIADTSESVIKVGVTASYAVITGIIGFPVIRDVVAEANAERKAAKAEKKAAKAAKEVKPGKNK